MIKKPKDWYKQIIIRPTLPVDGYESYEKVCGYVADVYFSGDKKFLDQKVIRNTAKSIDISFYTLFKVGEGRQQRKLVWIEPVLVMGGKESS
jgi:hypothetical protein